MEFNPNNNIVKLCLQAMNMEAKGQTEEANELFLQAWNEATNDFEKFMAAYFVAQHQKNIPKKLKWFETALQFALIVDNDAVKGALSSLYLNIAKCYEKLGKQDNAKKNYELATSLKENSTAQWGKMNIYQMLKHCTLYDDMMLGKKKYKRVFLGRLFGKIALKDFVNDESPIKRNTPTLTELKVKEKNGNVVSERKKWVSQIEEYSLFLNPDIIHSFFGKLTKEQVGYLVYKHTDHHLRQFNS